MMATLSSSRTEFENKILVIFDTKMQSEKPFRFFVQCNIHVPLNHWHWSEERWRKNHFVDDYSALEAKLFFKAHLTMA